MEIKDRILLLAAVVLTMGVGALVLQGWQAALFTLLGGAVTAALIIFATHRMADKKGNSR
jgi:uncharacterized membrane protein